MRILAIASPEVFSFSKPPLPDGAAPSDYTDKEFLLLFDDTPQVLRNSLDASIYAIIY